MKIQVLGTGCAKCKLLTSNVERAIREAGLEATIEKVEDVREIMKFDVFATPALVVDGVVKTSGHVVTAAKLKELLLAARA